MASTQCQPHAPNLHPVSDKPDRRQLFGGNETAHAAEQPPLVNPVSRAIRQPASVRNLVMSASPVHSRFLARPGWFAALLLAWFWGQVVSVSPDVGITADEPAHLTAGYAFWRFNDYRLQPENGNLSMRLAALPLCWARPKFPDLGNPDWQQAVTSRIAHEFLYRSGNNPDMLVWWGRVVIATVAAALGALVYLWARGLFGAPGGLVSVALFAASPNLLAHGGLVTSEIPVALGFIAAALASWRLLHRVTFDRLVLCTLALTGLFLAKHSAVVFALVLPILAIAALVRVRALPVRLAGWRTRLRGPPKLAAMVTAWLLVGLGCYTFLWAAYGFRYAATVDSPHTSFPVPWSTLLANEPALTGPPTLEGLPSGGQVAVKRDAVRATVEWIRQHRLLPEAYLYGFAHTYHYSKWRPAFFLGEYRLTGWGDFFPIVYLLKTPPAALVLCVMAVWVAVRATPRIHYRLVPLAAFVTVYGSIALASPLNIGYRHILPIEVMLCVLAGAVVAAVRRWQRWSIAVLMLLLASVQVSSFQVRPHYLAYFNLLAGGPAKAYRLVVDSSLDWGQGLPSLERWLATQPKREPRFLAYFGGDEPGRYQLDAFRIGDAYFDLGPRRTVLELVPGLFCISATLLQGVYTAAPGPWTEAHEAHYRRMAALIRASDSTAVTPAQASAWDHIRFARLRHYLRGRAPDAHAGHAILIHRLNAEELQAALEGPVTGW